MGRTQPLRLTLWGPGGGNEVGKNPHLKFNQTPNMQRLTDSKQLPVKGINQYIKN